MSLLEPSGDLCLHATCNILESTTARVPGRRTLCAAGLCALRAIAPRPRGLSRRPDTRGGGTVAHVRMNPSTASCLVVVMPMFKRVRRCHRMRRQLKPQRIAPAARVRSRVRAHRRIGRQGPGLVIDIVVRPSISKSIRIND